MRSLSDSFIQDLKSGVLSPLLERIKNDDTLLLAIRKDYINVYYRGGNILRITESEKGYGVEFDKKYDSSEGHVEFSKLKLPQRINTAKESLSVAKTIPALKELMDFWLFKHHKTEREYQQVLVRENNFKPLSNDTEYFVVDIEVADRQLGARFDLSAIRWNSSDRKSLQKCNVAFFEMKYGDNALEGKSGMIDHLDDITKFLQNKTKYYDYLDSVEKQFTQLDDLGLLDFKHAKNLKIELNKNNRPEFVFLLANHNPRSHCCPVNFKILENIAV